MREDSYEGRNLMKTRLFSSICKLVVFLILFLFISSMDTAWAKDWVWKFKIPVKLKNIPDRPEMKEVVVAVALYDKNNKLIKVLTSGPKLPINPDGTFSEVVEIAVYEGQIPPEWVAADAVKYRAYFGFKDGDIVFAPNAKGRPYSKSMPGTKFVEVVEGYFVNIKIIPGILKGKK